MFRWYVRRYADAFVEIKDYDGNVLYHVWNKTMYKDRLHLGMHEEHKCKSKLEAITLMQTKASEALRTVVERA